MKSLFFINTLLFLFHALSAQQSNNLDTGKMLKFNSEIKDNLVNNILPFWTKKMSDEKGGFYGRADINNKVYTNAERGGILNARILWTYSAAFRILKDSSYLKTATHAKDYILKNFIDRKFGGTFRSLNKNGKPEDTRKQTYSQSFFIYALAEYYRVTGDTNVLAHAMKIFSCVEKYCFDTLNNGYFEAYNRQWKRINDKLTGERSDADKKTMNTHLHLLEAYTNLYRVSHSYLVGKRLRNLIDIFNDRLIDKNTYHLIPFTDEKWEKTSSIVSYGHEIETSWLLTEAANVLEDKKLINNLNILSYKIVFAAREAIQQDGSIISEKDNSDNKYSEGREWWPQAETVVGFFNAYQIFNDISFFEEAKKCWEYINMNFVDHKGGEWYMYIKENGQPGGDKAGFWKCPYHNGRMCLEIIERINEIAHK